MAASRFSSLGAAAELESGQVSGVTTYGSDNVKRLIIRKLPRPASGSVWVRVTIPAEFTVDLGDTITVSGSHLLWTKGAAGMTIKIPKLGNILEVERAM